MRWKCALLVGLLTTAAAGTAFADDCTGRDHTTGTVLGALGGAAIGGAASHDAGGAVAGAVVGGLAGNAIARSEDCNRTDERRAAYGDPYRTGGVQYRPGYRGPDEDDYWGVESYDDFNKDYRHIYAEIQEGRDEGSLSRGRANHYLSELQRIRERADREQRSGRFDPQDIEARLHDLRGTIRYARAEGDDRNYRR